MNWLITGGCGFLGTSLIKRLVSQEGHNIRVVDNLLTGTKDDLGGVCDFFQVDAQEIQGAPAGVELVIADIMDEWMALQVVNGCDVIVHFAANTGVGPSVDDPRLDCLVNVIGTFNYLDAARLQGVSRFVFASSGAPAGDVEPPIHEELPPHPVSPYGASKSAGEGYCSAFYKTFGIDTVALRFGNVYGPASIHKNSVVAKFIRQALAGETLEIYGDGRQTRDFIYIDDLIDAVILAATQDNIGGEVFQIATNMETTLGEITGKIISELEAHGVSGVEVINGEVRLGDVMRNYSDTTKAKERLGWQAQVGLEQGLAATVNYFLDLGRE